MPRESHEQDPAAPVDADNDELVEAAAAGASDSASISEEVAVASEQEVRVRRTPRYGRFMILGGALFGAAAFIVTYSLPQGSGYDRNTVFGFVLVTSVAVGVGLGALAAIIASAATKHTERTVAADRIDVRQVGVDEPAADLPDLGELSAESENDVPAGGATAPKRDAE